MNKTITNTINHQSTIKPLTNTIISELKTLITSTTTKLIPLILFILILNTVETLQLNIKQYDGYIDHATIIECILTDIDESCLETPKILIDNIINPI